MLAANLRALSRRADARWRSAACWPTRMCRRCSPRCADGVDRLVRRDHRRAARPRATAALAARAAAAGIDDAPGGTRARGDAAGRARARARATASSCSDRSIPSGRRCPAYNCAPMDETLKARLIGAAVLVALAVLLIPELLSGRKTVEPVAEEGAVPRGTRTFTIELGGGPRQVRPHCHDGAATAPRRCRRPDAGGERRQRQSAEPATDRRRTAPPPAEARGRRRRHASRRPRRAAAPDRWPGRRLPSRASAPQPGGWAVQVGAFGIGRYRPQAGPRPRGRGLPRVRLAGASAAARRCTASASGPEAEKAGAEQLAGRLKAHGLPATVVQND